jgi:DNA-binding LacI/PurR family transcriptional regulator
MKVTQIRTEAMFSLVRQRFGPAAVHLVSLPEMGTSEYVMRLVEPRRQAGERMGVIALSCPRSVYAYLIDCKVPSVVLGSLYLDLRESLPSVDLDNFQAGQLLVQHLVERGRKRLGLLLGFSGRAGTDDLLNGVLAGMHAANLSPAALAARFYPGSEEGLRAQVRELLAKPSRPTALIVSDATTASWAREVAAELGLSVPGDLEIGYLHLTDGDSTSDLEHCPHAYPRESLERMFAQAVEMLWRRLEGVPQVSHNVSLPISIRGGNSSVQGARP